MARQIIDLPRIDLADLADDDLFIIRDSSAKKDMRVSVSQLKEIFGSELGVDAVATRNIQDNAVTTDKIWFKVPSRIIYLGKTDTKSGVRGASYLDASSSPTIQDTNYMQRNSDGTITVKKTGYYFLWSNCRIKDTKNTASIAYNIDYGSSRPSGDKGNWFIKTETIRLSLSSVRLLSLTAGQIVGVAVYVDGSDIMFVPGELGIMYMGDIDLEEK